MDRGNDLDERAIQQDIDSLVTTVPELVEHSSSPVEVLLAQASRNRLECNPTIEGPG